MGLSNMVAALKSFFGNVRANNVTQSRVEDFLVAYIHDKGLSKSTRNRHIAMLKAMYNWAMKEKPEANKPPLVTRNPLANMKPTSEKHLRRTRYLDPDEVDALLLACKDDFRPLVVTALHTGMRRGEIFSLRWEDSDFRSRLLRVKDTKGGEPKEIPMNDTLVTALKHLSSRFKQGYVFPSKTGGRLVDVKKSICNYNQEGETGKCALSRPQTHLCQLPRNEWRGPCDCA